LTGFTTIFAKSSVPTGVATHRNREKERNLLGAGTIFLAESVFGCTFSRLPATSCDGRRDSRTFPRSNATVRDLTPILDEWPFEPGMINVRLIEGIDGDPKIQVRLDLGVIQMHAEGRPDGQRPHGFGSLLEYFETRMDEEGPIAIDDEEPGSVEPGLASDFAGGASGEAEASFQPDSRGEPDGPVETGFTLSPDDCRALREEAGQYYHRYVALLVLEDFAGVIRDTTRNLRVVDLCRDHAEAEEDSLMLEQVRPYILMMRARACAGLAIKEDDPKVAVFAVDEGLDALRRHFESMDDEGGFEQAKEVRILRAMRETLVPQLPVSQQAELRERLQEAIRRENYELAAILRNELRMLGD
jgi:hypothetical protein